MDITENASGTLEFHVSRKARDRYKFDAALFALSGNVVLANFHAARIFAQKMNERRDLALFPEQTVRAGQINAMGLIDEILHFVIAQYRREKKPEVMALALEWLEARLGREPVNTALRAFADQFPPAAVYRGEVGLGAYLAGETNGTPHRQVVLEEMLMLWLANMNPAFSPFLELFDDTPLERETVYPQILAGLHDFFDTQPRFGPDSQNLIDMLRAPALASPHSLSGQLDFMRVRWGLLLGSYLYSLLRSLDLIKEEEKPSWLGPGPTWVYEFHGMEFEPERFSPDLDWMSSLVLVAKSTYVWLDQLSRKYGREIARLDQIPDEELDALARRGFSGLWLIGLWERSAASRRIKQLTGNPDANASAYSLYDYTIAGDLGGETAIQDLKVRAGRRGIRLASDMVPNHVGIYSRWVIEHPDWFISTDHSPFPSYTFNGPDLSEDSRVGLFLEDHYYNQTDAAVMFRRLDRWTGSEQYVYHGNDGTAMPWNDTAQLNYLNPEVRETVIQTIMHVARHFPIIRFDAAMTLAKRHYQRLWFPEPGTGGDIPSRAEFGLTKAQFDAAMPEEFWRQVVDRVAKEAPDSLLLAEAFWMMEGYFVRTLGMHRVYNSAFMNMLRDEENVKYRSVIKNTVEFDPEILKRYVNFMNNPDERTAVDQFGKGDKYFGICTMMATLPGLPMFGHGQFEGFSERYGMEFRRAKWDEQPDEALLERHGREIVPLLHRRRLFSGVQHFLLYDLFAADGRVNEDVFAYSNRVGSERALVLYHNRFATAAGSIRTSAAYSVKGEDGNRTLVQKSLGEGLGLHNEESYFCIFRDHITGLEFIRRSKDLFAEGLYVELAAYKSQVFVDFREVVDNRLGQYAELAAYLGGRGVPSIDEALTEILLRSVREPYGELVNAGLFARLAAARSTEPGAAVDPALLDEIEQKSIALLREVKAATAGTGDANAIAADIRRKLEFALALPALEPAARPAKYGAAVTYLQARWAETPAPWAPLFAWLFTHELGRTARESDFAGQSRSWLDEWLLAKILAAALQESGLDVGAAQRAVTLIKFLTTWQHWFEALATQPVPEPAPELAPAKGRAYQVLESWLRDGDVQQFLQIHRFKDVLWFNRESFDELLWWALLAAVIQISTTPNLAAGEARRQIADAYDVVRTLLHAEEASGYQVENLLEAARE